MPGASASCQRLSSQLQGMHTANVDYGFKGGF